MSCSAYRIVKRLSKRVRCSQTVVEGATDVMNAVPTTIDVFSDDADCRGGRDECGPYQSRIHVLLSKTIIGPYESAAY